MDDGHSGVGNGEVKRGGSGDFQLVLSYLKHGNGRGEFVIHATANTFSFSGIQPDEFLQRIGFARYAGRCPFFHDRCYYRVIAQAAQDRYGIEHHQQVHLLHATFDEFAGQLGELFNLQQREDTILSKIGSHMAGGSIFSTPMQLEIADTDIPLWIEEVKFPQLRELEHQRDQAQQQIDGLNRFLPLLYGSGTGLEHAVLDALQYLGLEAHFTKPGFTADILAQSPDGSHRFGVEVTGTNGAIKKDSKKLTQLSDFERIKENGEKAILVAATYNTTPIAQRAGKEDFTPQVLDYFSVHPVLLMTGWDLYRMVSDVLSSVRAKEDIVELLLMTKGRLEYQ